VPEAGFHSLQDASTTKNHKEAILPLHPLLAKELRAHVGACTSAELPVFDCLPTMDEFKADLKAAEIPFEDTRGRRADFHALRHILSTNLARLGVPVRVAMELMRHSDMRLTTKTYTDTAALPLVEAIGQLDPTSGKDFVSPRRSPVLGAEGH
jgi:integrase